mmetsp:Transcript_31481/g.62199  ORF Transcript_31481/g.62199 Transcript_31481/m.62199 type:complete len:108 (-) Transcript_31481:37-360(-)
MTAEISGIAKKIGREQGYTASEKSEDRVFICWKAGGNPIKRRPLSEGEDLVVLNLYLPYSLLRFLESPSDKQREEKAEKTSPSKRRQEITSDYRTRSKSPQKGLQKT